ncbi:hypothetical protein ACFVY9_12985 [Streptomyces sp. NPDC059544]|uniref:hypothetical protein n=1 Tax=Streptomyces sp. NPDC059544 TaxID=3346861 RepID=UPI00369940B7
MESQRTQPEPAASEAEAEGPAVAPDHTGRPAAEPTGAEPGPATPDASAGADGVPSSEDGPETAGANGQALDAPDAQGAHRAAGDDAPASAQEATPAPAEVSAPVHASADVPVPVPASRPGEAPAPGDGLQSGEAPASVPAITGEAPPSVPAIAGPSRDVPAPPGPSPRRRGRTAVLLAVAAVIGISAGTAVGYKVQADRPPTPLPPLNQPGLGYPAKPLPADRAPEPLSAAEDRRVKTDGDLRKLLVPQPKGARSFPARGAVDGWSDIASYARDFERPGNAFTNLTEKDLRRVAVAGWRQGAHRNVNISLVQFRSGQAAMDHAREQQSYVPREDRAGNDGDALGGSGNGRYYLYPAQRGTGFLPYRARAVFQRGDVMVDINIHDSKRIGKNEIRSLAERQLERLS